MKVEIAVAKVGKWATSESGDTLEVIERPRGGLSAVLVDGQRSGRAAKAISNLVARKAINELAEGVRDGAAARAAHDYLHVYKGGKVSATLNIVSVDLETETVVLSRNIKNRWASIGLGTLALVTAVSRMYVDKHWLSDVIMGGAFGYYSANTIVDWHDQKQADARNLSFRPTPNGFLLMYRF